MALKNSNVQMASVSQAGGSVTDKMTVVTTQMKMSMRVQQEVYMKQKIATAYLKIFWLICVVFEM